MNLSTFISRRADAALVVAFSLFPLTQQFPFRINIFLSWEGAYRLYLGQVPYRDFGIPMGFGYWLLPALFFKVFGPSMLSLIKTQVMLNIMAGLSFRYMLRRLDVPAWIRLATVLVFCLSYILMNFWPWYNNTVIIYGMVGLSLLLGAVRPNPTSPAYLRWLCIPAAAFFLFLSLFTKQDGGFLFFAISAFLVLYASFVERNWRMAGFFFGSFGLIGLAIILPFTRYSFSYWFNHGQPPHTARLSLRDISRVLLEGSEWIKFYLIMIFLLVTVKIRKWGWKGFQQSRREVFFLLVTLGILGSAAIFQVTSYTPPDNNIYFHAFAIAYILDGLSELLNWRPASAWPLACVIGAVLLWWSGSYWKYFEHVADRIFPPAAIATVSSTGENIINERTYAIDPDTTRREADNTWIAVPGMPSMRKIFLPPSTVAGIERLRQMQLFQPAASTRPHVLNMSELTPLARELNFREDRGPMEPLWYHLGVCMFNREADTTCSRIRARSYDLVLFEYLPSLNNFNPFRVRDSLLLHYRMVDSFPAPRRGATRGTIEVFEP